MVVRKPSRGIDMKTALTFAVFAFAGLCSSGALAQQPMQSYQQQTGGAVGRPTQLQEIQRFEGEEARRDQLGSPEALEEQYGAERMDLARRVADEADGSYRLVFNTGADAHQTVFHCHGHVLAGRSLGWPPG